MTCTAGSNNVGIGYLAGGSIISGSNNLCVGTNSGTSSSALNITTQSNQCVIGNNTTSDYHFSGASTTNINANATTLNLYPGNQNIVIGHTSGSTTIRNELVMKTPTTSGWTVMSAYAPVHKTVTITSSGCIAASFTVYITKFGRMVTVLFPYNQFTSTGSGSFTLPNLFGVGLRPIADSRVLTYNSSVTDGTYVITTNTVYSSSGDLTIRQSSAAAGFSNNSLITIFATTHTFICTDENA